MVVTTNFPAGYDLEPEDTDAYGGESDYELCAESFTEFIWRFWTENELWHALRNGTLPLGGALREYAGLY